MRTILSLMLVMSAPALAAEAPPAKAANANAGVPPALAPAAPPFDIGMWESQALGSVHGTFCGYYQDRITLLGQMVHVKDYKQCTTLFDGFAKQCVGDLKTAGEFHATTPEEGKILGGKIGNCIGVKFGEFGKTAK